jgi:hypothetical protein
MYAIFPNKPLIVYLDQNKWIDLTKARHGHNDGQKYQDVLKKILEVVKQDKAIFPLSWVHFIETRKKRNLQKRKELAEVMAEISRGIVILPKTIIQEWELQHAIATRFSHSPYTIPSVFGYGMPMIFGRNVIEREIFSNQIKGNLEDLIRRAKDTLSSKEAIVSFLVGDDESLNIKMVGGLEEIDSRFVVKTETFRDEERGNSNDLQEKMYMATLTSELQPKLTRILGYYDKTMKDFFVLGQAHIRKFFQDVPTIDVEIELALNLNKHWDRKLKVNDTKDVSFASISIPYCDVVVTEVFLKALLVRENMDKKYNTTILSNLNDLLPILDKL